MRIVDLADEFELTTAQTLDLCALAGVPAETGGDELSEEQVAAVRRAATAPPPLEPPPPNSSLAAPPSARPVPLAPPPAGPPTPMGPPTPLVPPGYAGEFAPPPPWPPPDATPAWPAPPPPPGSGIPSWATSPSLPAPPPPYGAPPGGAGYGWQPPPPGGIQVVSKSPIRAIVTVVALVVLVIAVPVLAIVLLGEDVDERDGSFEPLTALDAEDEGPDGGDEQSIFRLAVGDCLQEPTGEEIQTFSELPCDLPHDLEVFHSEDHPGGSDDPYPGLEVVETTANEVCERVFETFVGVAWIDSTLDIYHMYPIVEGWERLGDREIVCAIYDPAGPVSGTLKGAAR